MMRFARPDRLLDLGRRAAPERRPGRRRAAWRACPGTTWTSAAFGAPNAWPPTIDLLGDARTPAVCFVSALAEAGTAAPTRAARMQRLVARSRTRIRFSFVRLRG